MAYIKGVIFTSLKTP